MGHVILLGLLGGLLAGNGLPHFLRGITKQRYPCVFGNGPITNLVAGWASGMLAALCLRSARLATHPYVAIAAVGLGALLIGLFHAGPGAFGRPDRDDTEPR